MDAERLQIIVDQTAIAAAAQGVEIAVFTFAPAERDMDVDAERF
jgi:hypothetical protein